MPPPEKLNMPAFTSINAAHIDMSKNRRKFAFTLAEVFHPVSKSRRFAFTLAEVLITLGIIGIVAALTIPGMIAKHKQKVLHTAFLRSISVFNNATKMALNEYGVESTKNMTGNEFNNDFLPILLKNLKVVKIKEIKKLYPSHEVLNYYGNTQANSCFATDSPGITIKSYVLNDGQFFCFRSSNNWRGAYNTITFDSNGAKGPNQYGYDVFEFNIFNTLEPYSANGADFYCTRNPSATYSTHQSNGTFCAYWALKDINPDDRTKKYWDSLKF